MKESDHHLFVSSCFEQGVQLDIIKSISAFMTSYGGFYSSIGTMPACKDCKPIVRFTVLVVLF
jgi:hypothetical protein